jgi:hypothetical protein
MYLISEFRNIIKFFKDVAPGLSNKTPLHTPFRSNYSFDIVFIMVLISASFNDTFSNETTIQGVVCDHNGRPVSGVRICAYKSDFTIVPSSIPDISKKANNCTKTDRKGSYSIKLPELQTYTIIGTKDNLQFIRRYNANPVSVMNVDTIQPCGSIVFYIHKEKSLLYDSIAVILKGTPYCSQTDKSGKVVLNCLPSGNYNAHIISGKPEYHDVVCSLHIASEVSDTFSDTLWLLWDGKDSSKEISPQKTIQSIQVSKKSESIGQSKKSVINSNFQPDDSTNSKPIKRNYEKPKVYAGKDTTVGIKDVIKLHGDASIKEGRIVLQEWSIGKQSFSSTADGNLSFLAPVKSGTLQCFYRATADNDSFTIDTVTITVRSSPPRITLKGDSIAGIFDSIRICAKATDNGSIISTAWDIGNTGSFTRSDDSVLIIPPYDNPPPSITCIIRAIDDDGEMSFDTHTVKIQPIWKNIELPSKIPTRKSQVIVSFDGSLWIIGGNHSDIWRSSNLTDWEQIADSAKFGSRYGHSVIPFNGQLFVIGGKKSESTFANDIWRSPDGKTWRKVLEADFLRRHYHSVIEFKGRLWLIGGLGESDYEACLNDVWTSEDGISWKPVMDFAPFSRRYGHGVGVINSTLFVVGGIYEGFTGTKYLNDIWSSTDGISWNKVSEKAFEDDSVLFSFVQNNDRLWAIGDYCKPSSNEKPFSIISTSGNGILWEDRVSAKPVYSRVYCAIENFNNKIILYPADSRSMYLLK